jgi:hypothetical protein
MQKVYYKYLPIERINYFENGLLRFTQPQDLNDSFECLPVLQTCKELYNKISGKSYIESISNRVEMHQINAEYLLEDLINQKNNKSFDFGVFSLSKRYDSNLMWSHYAKHTGFVIGFDINHDYFISENFLFRDVLYSDVRTIFEDGDLNENIFFTKSIEWSYEEEFRIISLLNLANKIDKNIYLFKIPFDTISEIILGLNISYTNLLKIREFANVNNIPLYRSKQSKRTFFIERELII